MTDLVLRTDSDGVATLTLNRPEQLNALSPSLFVELRAHIVAIAAQQDTVGCVILRGAGKSFSAGADFYISKPYEWQRLLGHIQKLIG